MIILFHSSKTMKPTPPTRRLLTPVLLPQAVQLHQRLAALSVEQIAAVMGISATLAEKTAAGIASWTTDPARQSLALDCFVGDMYSGLQANTFSPSDRDYANAHLRILSGLYGVLRPDDGVCPYRLEMGYKLPTASGAQSLQAFWGDAIARTLPATGPILNASSDEYASTVLRYVDQRRVITPRFLTRRPTTGQPTFVVVHAKIARGAFARWLIQHRLTSENQLLTFAELGYAYDASVSSIDQPTFVCQEFGGKGLSVRLRP